MADILSQPVPSKIRGNNKYLMYQLLDFLLKIILKFLLKAYFSSNDLR